MKIHEEAHPATPAMRKPVWQFSIRKLLWWIFLCNISVLFFVRIPVDSIFCGPLVLIKAWQSHTGVGVLLCALIFPLIISFLLKPSLLTLVLSIVGIVLWLATYVLIWEMSAAV